MGKIATRNYIASLGGGSTVVDGNRCPNKSWIESNYSNIGINGAYATNQLVAESDIIYPVSDIVLDIENTTYSSIVTQPLLKTFNTAKAYSIEWSIVYTSVTSNYNMVAFLLLDSTGTNRGWLAGKTGNYNYFWLGLGTTGGASYGSNQVAVGVEFSGTCVYPGKGNGAPVITSNLPLRLTDPSGTPPNVDITQIHLGGDIRDAVRKDFSVTINKLLIKQ